MKNTYKYIIAAFLGFGICTGNADCSGIKFNFNASTYIRKQSKAREIKEDEKVSEVTCATVIRDYIDLNMHKGTYGNVLAFQCDVTVNGIQKNNAVIVLKNGNLSNDPQYVKGTNNVYYIPFKNVFNTINDKIKPDGYVFEAWKRRVSRNDEYWALNLDSIRQLISNQQINPDKLVENDLPQWRLESATPKCYIDHRDGWEKYAEDLRDNLDLTDDICSNIKTGGDQATRWFYAFQGWKYAKHTEVQFLVLQSCVNDGELELDDQNGNKVKFTKGCLDKRCLLFSMYEPCASCRELQRIKYDTVFLYFGVDRDFQINQGYLKQELRPCRIWRNGERPERAYENCSDSWDKLIQYCNDNDICQKYNFDKKLRENVINTISEDERQTLSKTLKYVSSRL